MEFDHVAQRVPDVAEAIAWQQRTIPGTTILYQDDTWGLVESGGAKLAFVLASQHPDHLAFRVGADELERIAAENGVAIATHRDGPRGVYLQGPGSLQTEIIHYPDAG